MKNFYRFWKCCGMALVCSLAVVAASCNDDDDEKRPVPSSVALEQVELTEHSVTFTLTPAEALAAYYAVIPASQSQPSVEQLFNGTGIPADPTIARKYTVGDLDLGTRYLVVAGARNVLGYSELAVLEVKTATPVPSVSLAAVKEGSSALTFKLTPVNASKAAYVCVKKGASLPDAEAVLADGIQADPETEADYIVRNLDSDTEYTILAAVRDLADEEAVLSEVLNMQTTQVLPPVVGDFYYSDGTWSTELDADKTPIGIVFYTGVATEFKDAASYYKCKDGKSALEEFHGYVVALQDATLVDGKNEGVWWSFYDGWYEGAGCSSQINDFLGYTNTQAIKAAALKRPGELTGDNDSFPATYYATIVYEETCPAPESSSGWFLPAAYQFKYIWDYVYFNSTGTASAYLEKSFETLGDLGTPLYTTDSQYWTSTEKYDSSACSYWAYYFCFDESRFSPGFITDYRKNENFRVRSMLVF